MRAFFAIHAKDTENTRCCCGVDFAACPLPRPVFVFALLFIRFKGINPMKFVAQL